MKILPEKMKMWCENGKLKWKWKYKVKMKIGCKIENMM